VDLILLVQVLPLALGAAVSPTVLTVQIVLMADGSPGLARAWGLAIGRTTALAVLCVGGVGLLNLLPDVNTGGPSLAEGLISLGAGLALGVMALIQWRRPRAPSAFPLWHCSSLRSMWSRVPLPPTWSSW